MPDGGPLMHAKRVLRESGLYPRLAPLVTRRARALLRPRFDRHLRPTDTFLVGHPKSGNTWMAYLLAILQQRDHEGAVTLANVGRFLPVIHGADHRIAQHGALTNPRIFRNEWPVYPDRYPRTVYIVRDPRSVLVSQFHMYKVTFPQDDAITLHRFVDEYLAHGCIRRWEPRLVRWDRQVESWLERAARHPGVLVVRYEDMVSDLRSVLARVVSFVGLPCDDALLERAVARGGFAAMKRDEERYGAEAYPGRKSERGRFVRRGRVDGWRNELPPAAAGRIERSFGPVMRSLGYRT